MHTIDDTKEATDDTAAAFDGTIQNVSYLILWLDRCLNTDVCFILLLMCVVLALMCFLCHNEKAGKRGSCPCSKEAKAACTWACGKGKKQEGVCGKGRWVWGEQSVACRDTRTAHAHVRAVTQMFNTRSQFAGLSFS